MRRDQLTINYFDNLDNEPLNKYKKILKIKKNYKFILLHLDLWSFKFHTISLSFDSPSKTIKFSYNLQRFQINGQDLIVPNFNTYSY
jgi:hypothetical protein